MIRFDRLMSERGACSRRDCRRFLKKHTILVNGETPKAVTQSVPQDAKLVVDGVAYDPVPMAVKLYKPLDVVCTLKDPWGRTDLAEVLPEPWRKHLHPVGRLDADTTGLLLFSSVGTLTQRLLHPKYQIPREYVAHIEGQVTPEMLAHIEGGVETTEGVFAGVIRDSGEDWIRLSVTEGKYRMVRRMLANAGGPVVALKRYNYGGVNLGEMEEGQVQPVEGAELEWLLAQLPQSS